MPSRLHLVEDEIDLDALAAFISKTLETDAWIIGDSLTLALVEEGYERAIPMKRFMKLREAFLRNQTKGGHSDGH